MCECMQVQVWMHIHTCVHTYGVQSLMSLFSLVVFYFHLLRQDLLKKELSHLARLVSHLTQRYPVSAMGALRLQVDCHTCLTFRWALGI